MRTVAHKPKGTEKTKPVQSTNPGRALSGQRPDVRSIRHLQRTIGNHAIQRLPQSKTESLKVDSARNASTEFDRIPVHASGYSNIQPKLKVNVPGDKYEQEADRIADQVMREGISGGEGHRREIQIQTTPQALTGDHSIRKKLGSEHNRKNLSTGGSPGEAPPSIEDGVRTTLRGGRSLTAAERGFFEPRMGADFRGVRVHDDAAAADSAAALGARAYAFGDHIAMGRSEYDFDSDRGKGLMAHELAHVMQNGGKEVVQRTPVALSAAEWIGAAALGLAVGDKVVDSSADISWKLDTATGVLLPGGRTDVGTYQQENPNITVWQKELEVSFWIGGSNKKAGITFGLAFSTDGKGIGDISARLIRTHDWPVWEARCTMELMPLRFASQNGKAIVRVTLTIAWANNFGFDLADGVDSEIWHLEGDGSFTRFRDNPLIRTEHRLT